MEKYFLNLLVQVKKSENFYAGEIKCDLNLTKS